MSEVKEKPLGFVGVVYVKMESIPFTGERHLKEPTDLVEFSAYLESQQRIKSLEEDADIAQIAFDIVDGQRLAAFARNNELENKISELEAQNKKLGEALKEAASELYTTSRANTFGNEWIQKENAIACGEAHSKAQAVLKELEIK